MNGRENSSTIPGRTDIEDGQVYPPRARSSFYIFTTFEIVRCLRSDHLASVALAVALLIYLQLPSVRVVYPKIDARTVLARMRGRM
ncbi:MAG: hypothetical protein IH973_11855 [Myxococcales bacterium]|nr:hypothetical protein [Myxococcales bacterium]